VHVKVAVPSLPALVLRTTTAVVDVLAGTGALQDLPAPQVMVLVAQGAA
jgi:hypothetical protein